MTVTEKELFDAATAQFSAESWWTGSNGNSFADLNGFRYCVSRADNGYSVGKNGALIATGLKTEALAQQRAFNDAAQTSLTTPRAYTNVVLDCTEVIA